MRIFQRNILNGVAKSIASGLRIFRAYLPTALPMDYATEAVNIAPFTRHPQIPARIPALDSSDSASDAEPQFSEDEHSSSDDPGSALTIIVLSSGDDTVSGNDTLFQSSSQSSSEQLSIASTLIVLSSDEDTGNQSVASRTRSQRACQRTTSTAPLIENDTNDPPPTSQPTDDNPLTDLQDRQRAPLRLLRRCLENRTRIESPMSEISDEEVDYGSFETNFNPSTDSDHQWSTSENDS